MLLFLFLNKLFDLKMFRLPGLLYLRNRECSTCFKFGTVCDHSDRVVDAVGLDLFLSLHRHCMLRHTLNSGYFCKIVSLSLLPSLKTFSYSCLTYFRISFSFYARNSAAIYFRKFCLVILSLETRLLRVLFAGDG